MLNAINKRVRRLASADDQGRVIVHPRNATLQLNVPNPYGGKPWLTAVIALSRNPSGSGRNLRFRAYLDGSLQPAGGAQTQSLGHGNDRTRTLTALGGRLAASVVRTAARRIPAAYLQPLTGKRWRTWLDIQLHTAPLDAGADALLPEPLKKLYNGGLPETKSGEPRIGVWAGPAGGPTGGIARMALMQIDESDFSMRDPRDAGTPERDGFNLNVSIAQVVEPATIENSNA